jgi:ABC-type amino acid transport substrate-binding protein
MDHTASADQRHPIACLTLLVILLFGLSAITPTSARGALDAARETGRFSVGYLAGAQPFSYTDTSGKAAGYAVELCGKIGEAMRHELKLPTLMVDFVPVPFAERFRVLEDGRIDVLCGAEPTLERRARLDFSIPILLGGTGAVIRTDAPVRLRQVLSGQGPSKQPIWRGSKDQAPEHRVVAVIGGTPVEKALMERLKAARIFVDVVPVTDTTAGLQLVLTRHADAFFNDRLLLIDAKEHSASGNQLLVVDRLFRRAPVALAVRRGDDDLRLLIDRTLSQLMRSGETSTIYGRYFGAPDRGTLDLFELMAFPD